jgi:hypothetical protein
MEQGRWATLLEMVDLLLNEKSKLWPKFLVNDVDLPGDVKPEAKKEGEIRLLPANSLTGSIITDAMGDIKTYTQSCSKEGAIKQ